MKENVIPKAQRPRYRIHYFLMSQSPEQRLVTKATIRKRCKIVHSTLSRWTNLKQGDSADIPAKALQVIADVLGVSINSLFAE